MPFNSIFPSSENAELRRRIAALRNYVAHAKAKSVGINKALAEREALLVQLEAQLANREPRRALSPMSV